MRPCNQCGTPIENDQIVCEPCARSNKETGFKPNVSVRPFGPDNQPMDPEPDYDTSFGQIGTVFHGVVFSLGALTAYAAGGTPIVILAGGLIGMIMSFVFIRMMI
jgi:hypothetical protein